MAQPQSSAKLGHRGERSGLDGCHVFITCSLCVVQLIHWNWLFHVVVSFSSPETVKHEPQHLLLSPALRGNLNQMPPEYLTPWKPCDSLHCFGRFCDWHWLDGESVIFLIDGVAKMITFLNAGLISSCELNPDTLYTRHYSRPWSTKMNEIWWVQHLVEKMDTSTQVWYK